jgi:hypothetical protein
MKINFLWVGDRITKNGKLTLKSFLDHGHQPVLWSYNKNCENIPSGVIIEDAGQIIHPDKVFSYKGRGDCRPNSYGGFSDLFRYYLLDKVGGWYCDMDVVCLKNFEEISNVDYIFRPHKLTDVVANIIKTPSNDPFLKECIKRTETEIDEENYRWIKPMEILKDVFNQFDLKKYIVSEDYFGYDNLDDIRKYLEIGYFNGKFKLPTYAFHWCNEAITTGTWDQTIKRDWEIPVPMTFYYKLLKKHKLL